MIAIEGLEEIENLRNDSLKTKCGVRELDKYQKTIYTYAAMNRKEKVD